MFIGYKDINKSRVTTRNGGGFSHWHGIRICACLLGRFFAKFGIAIGEFSSETKEPKLHKLGVFGANYCKKHPVWSIWVLFVWKWYTDRWEIRQKNWYRPFSHCIDQAGLGAFTAKSGCKHYNPPPLTVMWMNFDSPNFSSFCSLSAIISFQTCSNKCILYVLSFHKCIKIKYKMVNMYGVFRD